MIGHSKKFVIGMILGIISFSMTAKTIPLIALMAVMVISVGMTSAYGFSPNENHFTTIVKCIDSDLFVSAGAQYTNPSGGGSGHSRGCDNEVSTSPSASTPKFEPSSVNLFIKFLDENNQVVHECSEIIESPPTVIQLDCEFEGNTASIIDVKST